MSEKFGAPVRSSFATAAAPSYAEGRLAPLSIDLSGSLRTSAVAGAAPASPGSTRLLVVTDVLAVAVVAVTNCSVITVQEDNSVVNAPTAAFQIRRPLSDSTANQYAIGTQYRFTAAPGTQWQAGQTVGYIQLPALGSTTFLKDEQ